MNRKIIFSVLFITFFLHNAYSLSDRIRLGLKVNPGIGWSKPYGAMLEQGKPRFSLGYGFVFEYWFAENYAITTGLFGAMDGCNLKSRSAFENYNGLFRHSVTEKYTFHYVETPVSIKLKTNDIKSSSFCVWGQVGFSLNYTVSARATYTNTIPLPNGDPLIIEKDNILKKQNEVSRSLPNFRSNFFDFRLNASAGFEYRFDQRTSLVVGFQYQNGFVNNLIDHDAKKEPNVMRNMSMVVGVLF